MEFTPNSNLYKWAPGDVKGATITEMANNMDKIDAQLAENAKKTESLLSVKEYGAKGDGTTDDTIAIQNALDTNSPIVYLPQGTYIVKRSSATNGYGYALTSMGKNQIIRGAGKGKTIVKLLDEGIYPLGVIAIDNATIEDITIDGGFSASVAQSDLSACVQSNSNSIITRCHIKNAQGSCIGGVGSDIKWTDNVLEGFGDHALYIHADLDNTSAGTPIQTSKNIEIKNNTCIEIENYQNNSANGTNRGVIKVRGNVFSTVITGNIIYGDSGVWIEGDSRNANANPRNILITGNTLNTTYTGVYIQTYIHAQGDNGARLNDIDIITNKVNGGLNGIVLRLSRANIKNNTVMNVTDVAVTCFDDGDAGASVIRNNTFIGGKTGLYKPGYGTILAENLIENFTTQAMYDVYKVIAKTNIVKGNAKGFVLGISYDALKQAEYDKNIFINNTTAIELTANANSFILSDNVFINNTTTAVIPNGSRYNSNISVGNKVISGASFPKTSGDAVALYDGENSVVLKSLDNSKWRITVGNTGTITATKI